jgi:2-octaprenyl-6-methoxyphenol hydroxylase
VTADADAVVDLVVVGGGLVGASLVVALRTAGLRIALIEAAVPPDLPSQWDERCIALNHRSVQIMDMLALWSQLAVEAVPIAATHISERGRFGRVQFTAAEAGLDALGYNIPLRHLGHTVWQSAVAAGAQVFAPATVRSVHADAAGVAVQLDNGTTVRARLAAAADGAQSPVRQALGIVAEVHDYRQCAIVSAVRVQRPRPGMAYERFTPDGPIALLPKPGDACSLIWTLPTALADAAMAQSDAAFLAAAQQCFGERLGAFIELGRRSTYPLVQTLSTRLSGPRAVLLGNAAHALHPVAAQGFNLGLRDVSALAALLRETDVDDWGDLPRRYAVARTADVQRTSQFTDQLVRLFSNRVPGLAQLRHLGLLGLAHAAPVRQAVMRQNTGLSAARP